MANKDYLRLVDEKLAAEHEHGGGGPPYDGGMEARVTTLEAKWEAVIPTLATKSDVGEVRTDLHKMDASIKTWMIGTVVGLMIGFGGLFLAMTNALKPSASQHQQPVIVNNIPGPATSASHP